MIVWAAIAAGGLAFFLSVLATPLAGRVAHRFGMIDYPQRHKAHAQPTPLLGGCAVLAAILGPSLLVLAVASDWAANGSPHWLPQSLAMHVPGLASKTLVALGILLGAVLLHVVGLVDDRRNLSPWLKLGVQIAVAAATVSVLKIRVLELAGPAVSMIVSTVWLVTVMNAFNFMDNMDGLCAGVAMICAAALLGGAVSLGQLFVAGWLCLLIGSLGGFLVYNFAPAKIFMGDAGSLVVGYLLGVLSCLTSYVQSGQSELYGVFAPIVLLAVPVYDAASVILLRLKERRNPMVGDRRHLSHRLLRRGMKVRSAVGTIYLCTLATAIGASLLPHADPVGAVLVFCQTLAVLALIALLEASGRGGTQQ